MALTLDLPELALPSVRLPSIGTRNRRPQLTPEEEQSLLASIGHKAMSGLETVGNVLDTDSAAVRNVLAGRNPLPGLTDPNARISGRQLLEHWGVLGPNQEGLDLGDVAGLGAEILLDPKTYLTLGGSAFTKAGRALKAAGLGQDLTRTQRLGTTVRKVLGSASPEQIDAFARATEATHGMKTGTTAQKIAALGNDFLDQPFTTQGQFHVPGIIDANFNYPGGAAVAGKIESLGNTIAHGNLPFTRYSPGEHFAQAFNAAVKGARTARGQQIGKAATALENANRAGAREFIGDQIAHQHGLGMLDDAGQARIRQILEDPTLIANPEEKAIHDAIRPRLDEVLAEAQDYGMPTHELQDDLIKYVTRHLSTTPKSLTNARIPSSTGARNPRIFSGRTPSDIGRMDEFRNIAGGTTAIQEIARDPQVGKLLDELAPPSAIADYIEKTHGSKFGSLAGNAMGSPEQLAEVPGRAKAFATELRKLHELDPALVKEHGVFGNDVLPDIQQRLMSHGRAKASLDAIYNALADQGLVKRPELPQGFRFQPGHKVRDVGRGNIGAVENVTHNPNGGSLVDVRFTNPATGATRLVAIPESQLNALDLFDHNTTSVGDLLNSLGVQWGDQNAGALKKISERLGQPINDAYLDMRVPREIANDMMAIHEGFKSPDAVNRAVDLWDSLTNLTKAFQTSIRPAFHVRNRVSGLVQNLLGGMYNLGDELAVRGMLRGKTIGGISEVPVIRDLMAAKGLRAADDVAGTELFRQLMFQHELVGKHPGIAGSAVGATDIAAPRKVGDLLAEFPGGIGGSAPLSYRGALAKATGYGQPGTIGQKANPLNVRGLMGNTETSFAPLRGAEDAGYLVEAMNRASPFLTLLKKGLDPATAAAKVNAAQAVYASRHYTPVERELLTRLLPYYKFARQMTPYVAKELAQHPGGPMAQSIRASLVARDRDPLLPEQIKQGAAISLPDNPITGAAPEGVKRVIGQLGLMHEDPLQFATSLPIFGPSHGVRDAALEALSRTNPMLKGPLEFLTGRSLFQRGPLGGRPLEDLDPTIGRTIGNLLGREEPLHLPAERVIEAIAPNLPGGNLLSMARTLTDNRKSIGAKAANLLSGLRVTDISPSQIRAIQRDAAQELVRAIPGSKQFSDVYVSPQEFQQLSPEDQAAVLRAKAILTLLERQAREEKKQKAAGTT